MAASVIQCPHCHASFKAGGEDLRGRRIRCTRCKEVFTANGPAGRPSTPVAVPYAAPHGDPAGAPRPGIPVAPAGKPGGPRKPAPVAVGVAPPTQGAPGRAPGAGVGLLLALLLLLAGGAAVVGWLWLGGSGPEPGPGPVAGVGDDLPPVRPSPEESVTTGDGGTGPAKGNGEEPARPGAGESPADPTPPEVQPPDPGPGPGSPVGAGPDGGPAAGDPPAPPDPVPPPGPAREPLSPELQKKVNEAIERGVAYLRKHQMPNGVWTNPGPYGVGYSALPALTLLECEVPADDPAVQKAAKFVREEAQRLQHTYQLSLAILFLDKLGEKQDAPLIRRLALRLIAGQTAAGGWDYECPLLNNQEEYELMTFLHTTKPKLLDAAGRPVELPAAVPLRDDGTLPAPMQGGDDPGRLPAAVQPPEGGERAGIPLLFEAPGDNKAGGQNGAAQKPVKAVRPEFPVNRLSGKVRGLPVVAGPAPGPARADGPLPQSRRDDNSNTQFAMIALWAARRYNVPVERTMAVVDHRYLASQNRDDGWAYMIGQQGSNPAMTCVGLIGLAMGHGSRKETYGPLLGDFDIRTKGDPSIERGMKWLADHVGEPTGDLATAPQLQNLYYLWSLERVAMLYNFRTIGGKDWYGWCAEMLVARQGPDGHWFSRSYHGSSEELDTCLALLILKRTNLVRDLSETLELYTPIRGDKMGRIGGR